VLTRGIAFEILPRKFPLKCQGDGAVIIEFQQEMIGLLKYFPETKPEKATCNVIWN